MSSFSKLPRLIAAAALILLPGVSALAEPPACPAEVVKCCDVSRVAASPVEHRLQLGLQIWVEGNMDTTIGRLQEIQPAALRYSTGPNWRRTPPIDDRASYEEVRRYVSAAFQQAGKRSEEHVASLKRIFSGSNTEAHFIIWEPPVTLAESRGKKATPDKRSLSESAITVTAMFYVALLAELQQRGYPVDVVELSNEPDGDWNIRITPARYVKLVAETRRQAALHGVKLPRIAGPGVGRIASLGAYLADPQIAKALVRDIDHISVHAWDDRTNLDTLKEARNARQKLDRLGYQKPILVSELALTFLNPTDRDRGVGANLRAADAVSNQPAYAAKTLALTLGLAAAGYGPLMYWELNDQQWGKASYGLYSQRGDQRPILDAWRELSRLVRQTGRVDVVPLESNTIFGLTREGRITAIVAVNSSPKPVGLLLSQDLRGYAATASDRPHRKLAECSGGASGTRVIDPNGIAIIEVR